MQMPGAARAAGRRGGRSPPSRARSPAIHAVARVITVRRGWWPFGHHDVSSNADTICRHRGAGGRRLSALRYKAVGSAAPGGAGSLGIGPSAPPPSAPWHRAPGVYPSRPAHWARQGRRAGQIRADRHRAARFGGRWRGQYAGTCRKRFNGVAKGMPPVTWVLRSGPRDNPARQPNRNRQPDSADPASLGVACGGIRHTPDTHFH